MVVPDQVVVPVQDRQVRLAIVVLPAGGPLTHAIPGTFRPADPAPKVVPLDADCRGPREDPADHLDHQDKQDRQDRLAHWEDTDPAVAALPPQIFGHGDRMSHGNHSTAAPLLPVQT